MNATNDSHLPVPVPPPDGAEAAFSRLADEVSLLSAAVRGLAAKRDETPDYSETLGLIAAEQQTLRKGVETMAARPAMKLTPDAMAREIAAAGQQARAGDEAALATARQRMERTAGEFAALIGTAAGIRRQREHLAWTVGGGILAGLLIGIVLPGMIARELPASWHVPEQMAQRAVGGPSMWAAGSRLMRTDVPQAWNDLNAASVMLTDNRQAIAECERESARTAKPVKCSITVKPRGDE